MGTEVRHSNDDHTAIDDHSRLAHAAIHVRQRLERGPHGVRAGVSRRTGLRYGEGRA
jgi:hypothetical protein